MYKLVSQSHVADGLGRLKSLLEKHICTQGLSAIEKCGESALNVSDGTIRSLIAVVVFGTFVLDCFATFASLWKLFCCTALQSNCLQSEIAQTSGILSNPHIGLLKYDDCPDNGTLLTALPFNRAAPPMFL